MSVTGEETVPALAELRLDGRSLSAMLGGAQNQGIEDVIRRLLPRQRWFGAKDSIIRSVELSPLGDLEPGVHALAVADVDLGHEVQRYLLPLSAVWGEDAERRATETTPALARISDGARTGLLIDSAADPELAAALLAALQGDRRFQSESGTLVFDGRDALRALKTTGAPRALGAEQSNLSIAYGSEIILKLYRRLRAGAQPDVEVAEFLSEEGHFACTPQFLGEIRFEGRGEEPTTLAAAFAFVSNEGDAWAHLIKGLSDDLSGEGAFSPAVSVGALLGQRTAEMHKALAVETDNAAFAVEPLTSQDIAIWVEEVTAETSALLDRLEAGRERLPPQAQALADEVLAGREQLIARLQSVAGMTPSGGRSRIHGDYHLGQVLAADGDFIIIDFEGEPKRSLAERRAKSSPLRDVAGMLRSFHYAAVTGVSRAGPAAQSRADHWRDQVSADFLQAYRAHIASASSYPSDAAFAQALCDLFLLQKAIYEVGYELANRPDWVQIPLSGVRDLLR